MLVSETNFRYIFCSRKCMYPVILFCRKRFLPLVGQHQIFSFWPNCVYILTVFCWTVKGLTVKMLDTAALIAYMNCDFSFPVTGIPQGSTIGSPYVPLKNTKCLKSSLQQKTSSLVFTVWNPLWSEMVTLRISSKVVFYSKTKKLPLK